ncbi:hypothetical protein BMS3Bbin04_00830 [bacterium BMS3Bbin04]|nr:hypothetical protein BMS3Bbin04_00830 [bacterium BMS3Bbin04]
MLFENNIWIEAVAEYLWIVSDIARIIHINLIVIEFPVGKNLILVSIRDRCSETIRPVGFVIIPRGAEVKVDRIVTV